MHLMLPKPYQDELIYSVIARHFAYMQPIVIKSAQETIDGTSWFSTRYVRNANRLAEKTRPIWGLSGLEILDRHTLLPFNGAFLKPDAHLKCTECFLETNPHGGSVALGMGNSSVIEPKLFRFCVLCLEEDMDRFGETYWRRQHQLSGTLFCVKHGELLRNSMAPMSPLDRATMDATHYCRADAEPVAVLSGRETSLAREIATRSADILHGMPSRWLSPDPSEQYQTAAVEVGYGFGITMLQTRAFGADLIDYFGGELLVKLGCRLNERSRSIRKIFYKDGANHPLLHVLVQHFLGERQKATRSTLERQGLDNSFRQEWKCPNTFAKHEVGFRIPQVYLRRAKRGMREHYFHARCTCGYVFCFERPREGDPAMPLVKIVNNYGPAVETEVKRLYAQHGFIKKVCTELKMQHKTVRRILDGIRAGFEPSPEKIAALRKTWLENGRVKRGTTYQTLLKYDRKWLDSFPSRRGTRSRVPKPQPRHADDVALASQIEASARELREQGGLVTVNGLSRVLGRKLNVRGLKLMPNAAYILCKEIDVPSQALDQVRQYIAKARGAPRAE
ncbi:TnsD family Tn7-like transposition protein [Bradyrhizobium sp. CB1717]|uniref:TnsD family Tn7-like transposition protein n=1 Tax=Bradyrhizobium sp. CB1717 TaxID=3039154 RepID=UPI0024B0F550|nr:TnsD family Tn7-like transposition protein [Bradyrhizobium sp. CB1717]WFU24965.1 TnsD family Tn7-like transposition protein [Bradyrhizobium sp. CB1717]